MFTKNKSYKKMRQIGKKMYHFSNNFNIGKKLVNQANFSNLTKQTYIRLNPYNIIDLLIIMKLYRKIAFMKVACTILPFIVLSITDGLFVSVVMSSLNILLCATIFWSLSYDNNSLYFYKKHNIITILVAILVNVFIILIGHYYFADIVKKYILL